MGSQISSYLVYLGVGLTVVVWSAVVIPIWDRAAERRGGKWYLEGLLFICGPLTMAAIAMYPRGAGAAFSGPFPAINRGLFYVAIGLLVIAIFQGVQQPRRNAGPVIAATAFFYLALILSCFGGIDASFPEPYWTTPLVVMAFLIHGGYTFEWFFNVARASLRVILVLSFLALINPEIGFNYDESRTLAGLSRMEGIAEHPNTFAFVAVIGLLIEMRAGSKLFWKLLYIAGILMAQSTTAFVMAAIGIIVISTRLSKTIRLAAGLTAFLFACVALFDPGWAGRTIESAMPSTAGTLNGRTAIWRAVAYGFEKSPVFGYGPGLLGEDYRALYLPNFEAAAQAHSQWYQTLGGTGIVGVASLIFLAVVLSVFAVRARTATSGLTLALLAVMVTRGVSETPLRPSGVSVSTFCLIIVLVLIASAPRASDEQKEEVNDVEAIARPGLVAAPEAYPASHTPLLRLQATQTGRHSSRSYSSMITTLR